jgi:phosphomannomutase
LTDRLPIDRLPVDRLQGTDGIRRPVAPSTDYPNCTPLQAFLDHGVITEQFIELYCYAYASTLDGPIVVGWDPRDPEGLYTGAAVRGARKSGNPVWTVGICPTPGVALFQMHSGAAAAFMITASHNFRDQNGIKIFHGPNGLKLFPEDDRALTKRIFELGPVPSEETGTLENRRDEAMDLIRDFHLDPRNSWLEAGETLGDFPLIVDAANGAFSGIAADVLREVHGGEVIEVNGDTASGQVNTNSGVADLEGHESIARDDARFSNHAAVREVFDREGKAAVFDADGDRFYRLDYDPESDSILVLSGDETAVHQATYLAPPAPGTLYINTVESDLNAARHAATLGYETRLTAVGDKWVLQQAAADPAHYGIGSEETGHNISKGYLGDRNSSGGSSRVVFTGNGLKSALNTFVATRGLTPAQAHRPYAPGFKRTFYVYYTDKAALTAGSDVFEGVAAAITKACSLGPVRRVVHEAEPDMLYLAIDGEDGTQRGGVFVRNSGTEEKTGVNVRGPAEDAAALVELGQVAVLYLAAHIKSSAHAMAQAELRILEEVRGGPAQIAEPTGVNAERLFLELEHKEKVIRAAGDGTWEITDWGRRMLEAYNS